MKNKKIILIAAHDRKHVIGCQGKMPWHFPDDLKHFKQVTEGHCVIMGRKTFEAIGKALPNRQNIVLSRSKESSFEGCQTAKSLIEAIEIADSEIIYIIGGAQIYAQAIELADSLILTEIDAEFKGDAVFPDFNKSLYEEKTLQVFTAPYHAKIKKYRKK
ncbi:MAG: dihydrofolate reductase [Erysipelotrichaceae bacterium]|nr:dihydrofolate reductase [Erysipelotrichaceae bacterium]